MLDKYEDEQNSFCETVKSMICRNNKISHAYFIETSNYSNSYNLVKDFAKLLICRNHCVSEECSECNICQLIDNDLYDDLYIINPDGLWIKKEQILSLKEELSNKSLENNLRIYIINGADKLNKSAANAMLKFLEEPEKNIVGILISDNKYNVITTLLSRCQILKLKNDKTESTIPEYYDSMFDFLINLERIGTSSICYENEIWISKYHKKEEFDCCFNALINILMDCIKYKLNKKTKYENHISDIEYIVSKNNDDLLCKKIKIIESIKNDLKYNANLSLLLDRLIIDYVSLGGK